MHFGDDYPFEDITLDRAAAEEALMIAARLQHVEKERLTVEDLKRSAAELNIPPETIDRALLLMSARRLESVTKSRKLRFVDVVSLIVLLALETFMFITVITSSFVGVAPLWLSLAVIPAVLGCAVPNSHRVWRVIVLAWVFGALMALMSGWQGYLDRDLAPHALWTVPLAILVQLAAFAVSQRVNSRFTRNAAFAVPER